MDCHSGYSADSHSGFVYADFQLETAFCNFLLNVSLFLFVVNYLVYLMMFVNFIGYILSSDSSIINDELARKVGRNVHNLCKGFPRGSEENPLPGQLALS
jgi:hypothetical protein